MFLFSGTNVWKRTDTEGYTVFKLTDHSCFHENLLKPQDVNKLCNLEHNILWRTQTQWRRGNPGSVSVE